MNKIKRFLTPTTPEELEKLSKRLTPPDDIRDMVPIPGKPEDWLFHGLFGKLKNIFRKK